MADTAFSVPMHALHMARLQTREPAHHMHQYTSHSSLLCDTDKQAHMPTLPYIPAP